MGKFVSYTAILPIAHSAAVLTYRRCRTEIPVSRVPDDVIRKADEDIPVSFFLTGEPIYEIWSKARHNQMYLECRASDDDLIRIKEQILRNHPEASPDDIVLTRKGKKVIIYNFSEHHFSLFSSIENLENLNYKVKHFGYAPFVRVEKS